jgi:hypothetical protein
LLTKSYIFVTHILNTRKELCLIDNFWRSWILTTMVDMKPGPVLSSTNMSKLSGMNRFATFN